MLLIILIFIVFVIMFHDTFESDGPAFAILLGLSFLLTYWISLPFDGSKIITQTTEAKIMGFVETSTGSETIYDSTDDDGIHRYYFVKVSDDGRTDIDFVSSDISGFKLNELEANSTGALSVKKTVQECETGFNTWILWKSCGNNSVEFTVRKWMFKPVSNFNPLLSKSDYDNAIANGQ